jgi:hypothetical protein
LDSAFIEFDGEPTGNHTCDAQDREGKTFIALGDVCKKEEADREPDKRESHPGEKREKPRLGVAENVDAIEVRLQRPG